MQSKRVASSNSRDFQSKFSRQLQQSTLDQRSTRQSNYNRYSNQQPCSNFLNVFDPDTPGLPASNGTHICKTVLSCNSKNVKLRGNKENSKEYGKERGGAITTVK